MHAQGYTNGFCMITVFFSKDFNPGAPSMDIVFDEEMIVNQWSPIMW